MIEKIKVAEVNLCSLMIKEFSKTAIESNELFFHFMDARLQEMKG